MFVCLFVYITHSLLFPQSVTLTSFTPCVRGMAATGDSHRSISANYLVMGSMLSFLFILILLQVCLVFHFKQENITIMKKKTFYLGSYLRSTKKNAY